MMELMIVLVIIGLFLTVGARKLVTNGSDIKAEVRRFSLISKKLRDRARLDNRTYRLVFDLPSDSSKEQSYWVEGTNKPALLLTEDQRDELEDDVEEVEGKDGKKYKPDPQGFTQDGSVVKEAPATLPKGLFFESIEIDGDPVEKLSEGRIYIYFFPQGYVQHSAIHLTNRDNLEWTLVIHGLTGRSAIYAKNRELAEFKKE